MGTFGNMYYNGEGGVTISELTRQDDTQQIAEF